MWNPSLLILLAVIVLAASEATGQRGSHEEQEILASAVAHSGESAALYHDVLAMGDPGNDALGFWSRGSGVFHDDGIGWVQEQDAATSRADAPEGEIGAPQMEEPTPGESLEAARRAPLGDFQFGMNLSYIEFTDDSFGPVSDSGAYFGVLAYARVFDGLYLGGEVGGASTDSMWDMFDVGDDITIYPLELNAKYAFEPVQHVVIDFGGGLSYSYVEIDTGTVLGLLDEEEFDDWVFGGQLFADLLFRADRFWFGVNGKYQITEDFEDFDVAMDNWRLGVVIGLAF